MVELQIASSPSTVWNSLTVVVASIRKDCVIVQDRIGRLVDLRSAHALQGAR